MSRSSARDQSSVGRIYGRGAWGAGHVAGDVSHVAGNAGRCRARGEVRVGMVHGARVVRARGEGHAVMGV
jgi:hypothetical protein